MTYRERSDIEVLQRLLGIQKIFFNHKERLFISKASNGSVIAIKESHFPSISHNPHYVSELLRE